MKKQILLFILVLLPMVTKADDSGTCGDNLTWTYVEATKTLTISGSGAMRDYDDYYSQSPWYSYRQSMEVVIVESGVTSIGDFAFYRCSGLTSITIPNSVISIGEYAFYDCSGLTSITIPNSVTSIGKDAFYGCSRLASITIPNNVTSIGEYAFYDCSGLTSITIPNGVTSIGDYAFNECSGLTSITIPNSVTSIGNYAFYRCWRLTVITIPNSVTSIGDYAFSRCSGLTSVIIPNSVTSIGDYAFSSCLGLTSITIPNCVTSIGNHAFSNCPGLTSVTIPNSVTSIGVNPFGACSGLTSIKVESDNNVYDSRNDCNAIIKTETNELIAGCKKTVIPNTVTSIGYGAFSSCSGLTSITIPNSVTSIGKDAFWCSGLTSITIPNSVTSIGEWAFFSCSNLTSINIPNSVTSIGKAAFYDCFGLTSITIPNTMTSIGDGAFAGCGITSITIPNSVTSIGDGAFQECYSLTSITIPNSVTSIGNQAFCYCSGLTSITIPNSVTSIGKDAFYDCTELTDVYCYAETLPSTESDTFEYSNINNATLHVPASAIDEYRTTEPWSMFGTIDSSLPSNSYNLIYVVDGEEQSVEIVDVGAAITAKEEPTKEGYTFSGWSETPETMPAHDVTITGTFTINQYTIKFVVDGEEVASMTQDYQTAVIAPEVPEREGYTFAWEDMPETVPAHDVIVTGSFTVNTYKLIYIVDGESYKEIVEEYGAEVTPETNLEKEGYTFSGWSEIPETMPAHDVTITGTFTINQYTIKFVVDGEEVASMTQDYQTVIIAPEVSEREGYTFAWEDMPETVPARDVIVTGSYTVNQYTITYIIDGETYSSIVVDYGSTIVPPEVQEREGSTFTWGEYPEKMPAHDIIIEGTYTDGIDLVQGVQNTEIYTIDGKKVNRMQKGVNIVNGKKVIIR